MNLDQLAEKILDSLDDIARGLCSIDYGLPLSGETHAEMKNYLVEVLKRVEQKSHVPKVQRAFTMPFGKHKGLTFDEIEADDPNYLDWVEENMDNERVLEALTIWRGV